MPTPDSLSLLELAAGMLVAALGALVIRWAWKKAAKVDAEQTLDRAIEQWAASITAAPTPSVDDLWPGIEQRAFPRPRGVPSTVSDVEREREWREHRALHSIDHHRRYGFGGDTDGEIAEAVCAMWLTKEGE